MRTTFRSTRWEEAGTQAQTFDYAAEEAALVRLSALAKVMDNAIAIPGTDVRIGVDALLGFIPVVGDLVSQAISSYIIWEARKLGVSHFTIGRMITNTLVDTVIGFVPVVGDAFDVVFRANMRNMAILRKELEKRGAGRPVIDV